MFDQQPEQHEMVLAAIMDSGIEEWYCPICGRRFLMQWPPNYRKIILEAGDEYAIHHGGRSSDDGQIHLDEDTPQFAQEGDLNIDPGSDLTSWIEDLYLQPYLEWMDQVDFEGLWR